MAPLLHFPERLEIIKAELQAEVGLLHAKAVGKEFDVALQLGHRPSESLLSDVQVDKSSLHKLDSSRDCFAAVLKDHPDLKISAIGAYDDWDRRECAVSNAAEWQARCVRHMKDLGGTANIPKVIHQIWIGPKEPPCLWMDTFRVSYLEAHRDWACQMWDDETAAKLPMINERIYTEEQMWQCKADILRLEILWHHGGVYVDADMVSVGSKSLDPIIELGKNTGFVIAYEPPGPNTEDKPYSILGNSVVACTPHHPLTLMLILFLKQTYYRKRPCIEDKDVWLVTGPVMYTKCLIDTEMPLSIAPRELLYPAFHFVPNPDAIEYSRFPECLMFQFGYTTSGLEGYVRRRNRCMNARTCPFHSKTRLLDSFRKLPSCSDAEICDQARIGLAYLRQLADTFATPDSVPQDQGVATFITDGELAQQHELRNKLPSIVDQMQYQAWDVILVGVEWLADSEEIVLVNVSPDWQPQSCITVGVLVNVGGTKNKEVLCSSLRACATVNGFDSSPLVNAARELSVWFVAQTRARRAM